MNKDILTWLQNWYSQQCDGDWEHQYGISIDTLDNPGWVIRIDLLSTELEQKAFLEINDQRSENNWIQCEIKDNKFLGYGGITNLKELIQIFVDWVKS